MKAKHYAYLAGLIDGDGCVDAYVAQSDGSTWYRVYLAVNSVEHKVIKRLEELFGGKGHKRERPHYKHGFIWEWKLIVKQDVNDLIEQMIPYLVLKREQARLAVQFLNLPRGCPKDREALIREIQRLNQKETSEGELRDIGQLRWPYLAGLMDAEGTFTVRRDERDNYVHYGIWARLANKNRHVIDWLEKFFGIESTQDATSYYWPLPYERKEKERFILKLLPYLVTKKDQAKVLLEYIRMGDERNPAKREALYQRCFDLNHPVPALAVTTLCNRRPQPAPESVSRVELSPGSDSEHSGPVDR